MSARLSNVLVAREGTKPVDLDCLRRFGRSIRLLVDCGAFADHAAGREPMGVFDWMAWARNLRRELMDYVAEISFITLDVIGDQAATRRNYEVLLDADFKVWPVLTPGCTDEDVQRYLDTSDYIFIGGTKGYRASDRRRIRELSEVIPDTHRQHWLGFTRHDYILRYRPTSIDSSNVTSTYRYGEVDYLDPSGRLRNADPSRLNPDQRRAIRRLGFDPLDIAAPVDNTVATSSAHACLTTEAHIQYARLLERRAGTRYYIATGTWTMSLLRVLQRDQGGPCIPSLTSAEIRRLAGFDRTGMGVISPEEMPEHRDICAHWRKMHC